MWRLFCVLCAAKCALDRSEENPSGDPMVLAHVLEQVIAHSGIYAKAQLPLGDLFLQIAASDFPAFVNTHLPHSRPRTSTRFSIWWTGFNEYANNGSGSGGRQRFPAILTALGSTVLANWTNSIRSWKTVAYGSVP